MFGFGPEMVLVLTTDIYDTKMLIDDKDVPMYTPSLEVGEGGDDEDYEREVPPPSDIDGCDWDGLSSSFMT
jgi:hypothetical protein